MSGVEGYMYPNEITLYWSVLIVLYPYITGLVAGAFILASLERVFRVEAVKPTYRLALLTALAFLLVAPLPLVLHLGHPFRSPEMYFTPHSTSAMAMFGYVYLVVPDGRAGAGDMAGLPARDRAAVAVQQRLVAP
jgi:Ni/Fe-hydrogenase subunit HybB-like protein